MEVSHYNIFRQIRSSVACGINVIFRVVFRKPAKLIVTCFLFSLVGINACSGGDSLTEWKSFRGPSGQGYADTADIPTRWSEDENVQWKTGIPGKGFSAPVINDNQIWLTTAFHVPVGLLTIRAVSQLPCLIQQRCMRSAWIAKRVRLFGV